MLRQRWTRNDRGVTLVELMVVMIVMGLFAGIVISTIMWATRTTTAQTRNAELWADMQDASTQLARDVNDASSLTLADANTLTVQVVRDDKCQIREWVADTITKRLTVTTTFYDQVECSGGSTVREDRIIGNNAVGTNAAGSNPTQFLSPVTFAYFDNLSTVPLATPSEPDRVSRISWTLVAEADAGYRDETLTAGAAFPDRPGAKTGDGDQADPLKPLLCASLATPVAPACGPVPAAAAGKFEGVHDPVLQWVDPTAPLTQGWTIWRIANPEGMSSTDPARTTWAWLGVTAATQTWYADTTLPDGFTAQYVVRATVATGVGPESNQVITGNRPATTVTRANGATTQIAVDWDAVIGATGYDVYRDGILARSVTTGSTLTWTDTVGQPGWTGIGYGHSHYYRVVPTNRWENRLTIGTDAGRLALGTALGAYPVGGARLASAVNAASGDFTAPNTPTHAVTANANRTSTISWTAAAWVGSGPTTGRETAWVVQYRSSNEGQTTLATLGATTTTYNHPGRPAGRWSEYQVVGRNASGDSPASGFKRAWQRPATPSCSTSGATTRSLVVTGAIADTVDEAYAFANLDVRRDVVDIWYTNGTTIDPLPHGVSHGMWVRAYGPQSGRWSDTGNCAGTTVTLATPVISIWGVTTRGASTSASCTNGSSCTSSIAGGAPSSNYLRDGTYYGVTANNTDGYNNVGSSSGFTTPWLAWPAYPTCTAEANFPYAPTTVNYTSNGNLNKTSEWAASAGTYTATASASITDGYNTNTRYTSCGVYVAPPPAPGPVNVGVCFGARHSNGPAGSGGSGFNGISVIQVCFGGSAGATGFQSQYRYTTNTGLTAWLTGQNPSPGGWDYVAACIYPAGTTATNPEARVRATNAYGVSDWTQWTSAPTGPLTTCV